MVRTWWEVKQCRLDDRRSCRGEWNAERTVCITIQSIRLCILHPRLLLLEKGARKVNKEDQSRPIDVDDMFSWKTSMGRCSLRNERQRPGEESQPSKPTLPVRLQPPRAKPLLTINSFQSWYPEFESLSLVSKSRKRKRGRMKCPSSLTNSAGQASPYVSI